MATLKDKVEVSPKSETALEKKARRDRDKERKP